MTEKLYSIGEVSKKLDIPISTIRYYDKHELLPFVKRTEAGNRQFDELDLEILRYIICFKTASMPIKEIKRYVTLYQLGDDTISERYEIINKQKVLVHEKIEALNKALTVLEDKAKSYSSQL